MFDIHVTCSISRLDAVAIFQIATVPGRPYLFKRFTSLGPASSSTDRGTVPAAGESTTTVCRRAFAQEVFRRTFDNPFVAIVFWNLLGRLLLSRGVCLYP